MIKRDYILNMIEQLILRLQLLTGMIDLKDFDGAFQLIDETMEEFFGWRSDFVNAIGEETLLAMLRDGNGRLDVDSTTLLAVLLKAEGDVHAARGHDQQGYHRYLRALHLFLTAHEEDHASTVPAEWDHTLPVVEALSNFQLPVATQQRLYHYLCDKGRWADAETWLWEIADSEGAPDAWHEEGDRFYDHLLAQSDPALSVGGLTRAEVHDGMAEWRER